MIGRLLKRIQRIIKLQIYFVTTPCDEEEERLSCSLMFSRIPNFSMSVLVRFAGALVTELLLESFLSARLVWGQLLLLQSWMRDFILSRRWLVWMDCTAHRGIPAKAVWQRLTMVLDNQNDACQSVRSSIFFCIRLRIPGGGVLLNPVRFGVKERMQASGDSRRVVLVLLLFQSVCATRWRACW